MKRELPWAAAVFLAALGMYWLTLAPGLIGLVDTPKLQFVGAILGVPHPPGYPLYIVLSHGFSHLPFGSLAYRINLMSAVFGAVTVALVFLCGRRAGAGRFASAVGSFGLACGPLFWSPAVVAEVYTLHTALLAAILLSLLSWAHTRSVTTYFAAVGFVALSLGHHTTMLLLGPAFAAYVLLVDSHFALRPRRLALTAGVLALGLVPYGLIAIRTLQGAAFVETPVASLGDALAAVSGRRWQSSVFAFDIAALLRDRVPFVAERLAREFSWPGTIAVTSGVLYVLARHRPLAVLFVLSGLINAVFVLVYDIDEIAVFLLPTVVTGWLCAAVFIGEIGPVARRPGWAVSAVLVVVLVGWTGRQVQRGYDQSDRSDEYHEIRRFDALFEMLPARSVVVSDDYLIDSMVRYKLLGEGAAGERDIRGPIPPDKTQIRQLHDSSFEIFAFPQSARELRLEGYRFAEAALFERRETHGAFVPAAISRDGTSESFDPMRGVELDQGRKGFGLAHIRSMQLSRLVAPGSCIDLPSERWVDIGQLAREGKVAVRLEGSAVLEMYVGRDTALAPRLRYRSDGSRTTLQTHNLDPEDRADGLPTDRPAAIVGLTMEGSQSAAPDHTMLVFGGVPEVAVARRSGADEGTARICSATLGYDGLFGDLARRAERIDWRRNGHDEFLGDGWDGVYPERMRRITDTTAELLLPIWRRDVLHLSVIAVRPEWIPRDQLGVIQLEIQGGMLESHSVLRGWTTYEWTIPIEAVELGVNQVYLSVSPVEPAPEQANRRRGIRVREVDLSLGDSG